MNKRQYPGSERGGDVAGVESTPQSSVPWAGLLAGLGAAVIDEKKKINSLFNNTLSNRDRFFFLDYRCVNGYILVTIHFREHMSSIEPLFQQLN
jgi:hypothetical protein